MSNFGDAAVIVGDRSCVVDLAKEPQHLEESSTSVRSTTNNRSTSSHPQLASRPSRSLSKSTSHNSLANTGTDASRHDLIGTTCANATNLVGLTICPLPRLSSPGRGCVGTSYPTATNAVTGLRQRFQEFVAHRCCANRWTARSDIARAMTGG